MASDFYQIIAAFSICTLPIWLILCFLNAARPSEQAGSSACVGNVTLEETELHQRNISTQKWHHVPPFSVYVVCNVAAVGKLRNKEKTSSLITFQGRQKYSGILRRHQGFSSSARGFCDSFVNNAAANVTRWSSSETRLERSRRRRAARLRPPPAPSCLLLPPTVIRSRFRSDHITVPGDPMETARPCLFIKR